jgi:hypothetical protein
MPHYENEVPFEVRESWEWVTLGELCSFLSRGKSPKYSEERIYPVFAQKCNLYDGDISLEKARFLDPDTISKWSEEYKLRDGDVLVNSTGTGTVGRTRFRNFGRKSNLFLYKGSSGEWEMSWVTIWKPFSIPRSALDCFQRTPILSHQPFL